MNELVANGILYYCLATSVALTLSMVKPEWFYPWTFWVCFFALTLATIYWGVVVFNAWVPPLPAPPKNLTYEWLNKI